MLRLRLLPLCLLGACAAPAAAPAHDWSWVWILTGPQDAHVQGEARQAAFTGHFANMGRLAEEGALLLAGPFAEPRAQADHRGIFVLATEDAAEAQALAGTDPAAQAGVFVFDVESFHTSDRLDLVAGMHERAVAASGEPNPAPGFHARPYVLVSGRPARAAERALAPSTASVLFAGRLGAGGGARALYCLDAQNAEEARALLDALPASGVEWVVMPWFATAELVNLRGAAPSAPR